MKRIIAIMSALALLAAPAVYAEPEAAEDCTVRFYRDAEHTEEVQKGDIAVGDLVYYGITAREGLAVSMCRPNIKHSRIFYDDPAAEAPSWCTPNERGSEPGDNWFKASVPGDGIDFGVTTVTAGDVNRDGRVDSKDVQSLFTGLNGNTGEYWTHIVNNGGCDTFADGKLNMKDVATLMKYVAGWDIVLCEGEAKYFTVIPLCDFDVICKCPAEPELGSDRYLNDFYGFAEFFSVNGMEYPEALTESVFYAGPKYEKYADVIVFAVPAGAVMEDTDIRFYSGGVPHYDMDPMPENVNEIDWYVLGIK